MATQVLDAREQKVQEYMATGRDRLAAENLADGLPEWSQRIDCSLRDLPNTAKALEENKARQDSENSRNRRPPYSLSQLEDSLRHIEENIEQRENQKQNCESNLRRWERNLKAATEILVDLEGVIGTQARADRSLAQETVDKLTPRIKLERDRLEIIDGLLVMWKEKLKNFPYAAMKKLQVEANRRDRLRF